MVEVNVTPERRCYVFIPEVGSLAVLCACLPTALYAQASITGTVKDTSGAVLPGVTVEASSPELIEKVRSTSPTRPASIELKTSVPGHSR